MDRPGAVFRSVLFALLLAGGGTGVVAGPVLAGSSDNTKEADAIRRTAKANAKSKIGYPDIFDYVVRDESSRANDFYYLGRQIDQLSRFLHDVSRALGQSIPPPLAGGTPPGGITGMYGPDGPTVKSVRLILEYRLMVAGNPRLKIGKIADGTGFVTAQVVTSDGSLVDEFRVDKKTGVWTSVR